ncbi:hypothetical protein AAZX31_20G038400 [Glycine max]|uniref:Uncharacterized protein n=3 Tax=Glycine subgen. Soja TaxID=1462606 RepID=K7N1G3_SOYBN|nr:hypothetical protein JHK86_055112 [Glycine max]KAG4909236.1 hypothetical protein JHK87_055352 [Glycine soja]KAG5076580.1 hypothetical protein JHK82_055275 [Glycine max]KAH1034478.1 hypothetical protein GYH30_054763 [Glycine max]KRG89710.1 hypothetical protein GLYMA_20G042900v4 [Glycine max]
MRVMSLACFFVLLLVLLLLQLQSFSTAATTNESAKFQNFESGSMPKPSSFQEAKQGFRQNSGEGGSEAVLGEEKRKIYTGPNPLHNR